MAPLRPEGALKNLFVGESGCQGSAERTGGGQKRLQKGPCAFGLRVGRRAEGDLRAQEASGVGGVGLRHGAEHQVGDR